MDKEPQDADWQEEEPQTTTTSSHQSSGFPKALKQIVTVKAYTDKYNYNVPVPYFVLLGTQASGKTTLVEYILKMPVGHTFVGIGNKCPVVYKLINNSSFYRPKVNIDCGKGGLDLDDPFQLPEYVKKHMESLQTVVSDPIYVTITSAQVVDFVFVDLPGFQWKEKEITDRIMEVVSGYLKQPHTFILGMVKATEALDTNGELESLKQLFEEHQINMTDRVIILVNKIDLQRTSWKGSKLRDLLLLDQPFPYYYTSLNPNGLVCDKMGPNEKQRYIETLDDEERSFFENQVRPYLKPISKKEIKDHFLLKNAREILEVKLSQFFIKSIDPITASFKKRKAELASLIHNLEREIAEGEADKSEEELLDERLNRVVTAFLEQILGLIEVRSVVDERHANITSYDQKVTHKYDPERYGTTFFKEMELGEELDWNFVPEKGELIDKLKRKPGQLLLSQLTQQRIGRPAFLRLKKLLELFILEKRFEHYSDEAILQIGEAGRYHKFDGDRAVTEMVKGQINGANTGIIWFSHIIEALIKDYCNVVLDYLQSSSDGKISDTSKTLYFHTSNFFMEYVKKCLNFLNKRWKESVDMYTSDEMSYDISIQSILYLLNCPLEDIVMSQDLRKEANSSKLREDHPEKENSQEREAQMKRAYEKIESIKKVRDTLSQSRDVFTSADIVEGGFSIIYTPDPSYVNYDYLRGVAVEYYLLVLQRFLFDFDSAFIFYFHSKLSVMKSLSISNFILEQFRKEGKVLARIREKIKDENEELMDRLEKAKIELDEVETVMQELGVFSKG